MRWVSNTVLVTAADDLSLRLWDINQGACVSTLPLPTLPVDLQVTGDLALVTTTDHTHQRRLLLARIKT